MMNLSFKFNNVITQGQKGLTFRYIKESKQGVGNFRLNQVFILIFEN